MMLSPFFGQPTFFYIIHLFSRFVNRIEDFLWRFHIKYPWSRRDDMPSLRQG